MNRSPLSEDDSAIMNSIIAAVELLEHPKADYCCYAKLETYQSFIGYLINKNYGDDDELSEHGIMDFFETMDGSELYNHVQAFKIYQLTAENARLTAEVNELKRQIEGIR